MTDCRSANRLTFIRRAAAASKRQRYFPHDPVGFAQDFDDLLIVHHVLEGQHPALAIFEPFLRGLISADMEFPRDLRHALEILVGVDHYAAKAPLPFRGEVGRGGCRKNRLHRHIVCPRNGGTLVRIRRRANRMRFHQVKSAKLAALFGDMRKDLRAGRIGNAREIDFQELRIGAAVVRRMEDAIDIIEHAKFVGQILPQRGRGTIRRMVEGHRRVLVSFQRRDTLHVPLHHFVVPLPRSGEELTPPAP